MGISLFASTWFKALLATVFFNFSASPYTLIYHWDSILLCCWRI
jgi:hypothetical protein